MKLSESRQAARCLVEDMEMLLSGEWEPEPGSIQDSLDNAIEVSEALGKYEGALRAILTRIDGEFDAPELGAFGPLQANVSADVKAIAKQALGV